jgi:hypothetical protein
VKSYSQDGWDTGFLMRARPRALAEKHYREVEEWLGVGIIIESRGPTAGDKKWVSERSVLPCLGLLGAHELTGAAR